MVYLPNEHHRRSIRLPEYDYAQPGYYFFTICTKNREHLFGKIVNEKMQLSRVGYIVQRMWRSTPLIRPYVSLDAFIVMSNHMHCIIRIMYKNTLENHRRDVLQHIPTQTLRTPSQTLGAIIRGFKEATTKRINIMTNNVKNGSIWQLNYYEHIVRNEHVLNRIRNYIANNPINWERDIENRG